MKKYISFIALLIFLSVNVSASSAIPPLDSLSAKSFLSVELGSDLTADTDDTILYKKNQSDKIYPASITKIMTAVVVMEYLSKDELLQKTGSINLEMYTSLLEQSSSMTGLLANETANYLDLLYGLLLPSGGDAATILALGISNNDINAFVDLMNATAKKIGLKSTNFTNPIGLDDDNMYSSAEDIIKLTTYAMYKMKNSALFREIVSTETYLIKTNRRPYGHEVRNSNLLIRTQQIDKRVEKLDGIIGVKTGTTTNAGQCLVTAYSKNGFNIITVVLGCEGTQKYSAFTDTATIYSNILKNFEIFTDIKTVKPPLVNIKYAKNKDGSSLFTAYPEENIRLVIPKVSAKSLSIVARDSSLLKAPIKANTNILQGDIYLDGTIISSTNLFINSDINIHITYIAYWSFLAIIVLFLILLICRIVFVSIKRKQMRKKRRYKKTLR